MGQDSNTRETDEKDIGRDVSRQKILQQTSSPSSPSEPIAPRPASQTSVRPSRRSVLSGLATVATGSLVMGAASANSDRWTDLRTPEIEGPVTGGVRTGEPQTASVPDVSEWGYTEEEYFLSGEALSLDTNETAEYKTRILVYRPENPRDFNGTVVVNWSNVTAQTDAPSAWIGQHEFLMREGYAVVAASVQKQGVDGSPISLRFWDPVRYEDVSHPGDEFSYDIYSQMAYALQMRPRPDPDPLRGLNAKTVLATGASQSAGYLQTYINEVQELHDLYDGFMPFVSGPGSNREDVRDDLVPVLWVNSETEADPNVRPDAGLFRLWEVAGAGHVDHWWHAYVNYYMWPRDHGSANETSVEREWDPQQEGQYGEQGGSPCPSNYYPFRHPLRAAMHHLTEWVTKNREPPTARLEYDDMGNVATDEHLNALGGVRMPIIDVPVATYDATRCGLHGQTIQFDPLTLQEMYPTHDEYISQMEAATDQAISDGFLLPADGEDLMERARASDIGESSL